MELSKMRIETKFSNNGLVFQGQFINFSVSFVNALRRIILHGIPTVVVRDILILENTTQIPHEMLQHRVEMLPINLSPEDASTIRDSRIELRIPASSEPTRLITSDDFSNKLILRDPLYDSPLTFLRLRANEAIHLKARLAVDTEKSSQVEVCTTSWTIDPERAAVDREAFGKNVVDFDNFYIQKSYYRDEKGYPTNITLSMQSVGVLTCKDILRYAIGILRKRIEEYVKKDISRSSDENTYSITASEDHTVGSLLQETLYADENVSFVSYDIPHNLLPDMVIQFTTSKKPESVLKTAVDVIEEYCKEVEKIL